MTGEMKLCSPFSLFSGLREVHWTLFFYFIGAVRCTFVLFSTYYYYYLPLLSLPARPAHSFDIIAMISARRLALSFFLLKTLGGTSVISLTVDPQYSF